MSSDAGSGTSGGSSSNLELQKLKPGDNEDALRDTEHALQAGLFGVLYTVSKEKKYTLHFVAFRLLLDWLQLFLLVFNPQYGYAFDPKSILWRIFSFVTLNDFMSARGYTFFVACLYVMVAGLAAAIALCFWVAHSFQNNRFEHVWPITLLRWYGNIFFQVLDIASMSLFLMTLDCQYLSGLYYNQEFPDVMCWSTIHLIHVAASVVSLLLFVLLAGMFTMAEMELNPLTKNPMAMAHTKVEVTGFFIKVVMTCTSVFLSGKWMAGIQLLLSFILVTLYIYWVPHYNARVNYIRCSSYATVLLVACMTLFLAVMPGVDMEDLSAVASTQKNITYATYALVIIFAAAGWALCWWRLRHFSMVVVNKFRSAAPGTKARKIYCFHDPREVEITVRCCRVWVDEEDDMLDEQATRLAETILKAGLAIHPKHPDMILLYSSFLIDVLGSYQSGYTALQAAKKQEPSFMQRFAIFSREQQHTQRSSVGAPGEATDLVSYVEFQRNYRLATKMHREALIAARFFWQCLMHSAVNFNTLASAVQQMDTSTKTAERVYRTVLQRHGNNVKMVRLYAKFLEAVKSDPWAAANWFKEAEKLEQNEEDAKNRNLLGLGDGGSSDASANYLAALGDETRGIIFMDAKCTIQMINDVAYQMLGYSKGELKGRDINTIIPPPFSARHTSFVRTYIEGGCKAGTETVVNRTNEVIVLHKDRHVFGVNLSVTKVSGIGEDSLFMGCFEPTAALDANTAHIWIISSTSQVVSVDDTFTDWFGFKVDDIFGSTASTMVADGQRLIEVFKEARVAQRNGTKKYSGEHEASNGGASEQASSSLQKDGAEVAPKTAPQKRFWSVPNMQIRHKYGNPLTVDIIVSLAGVGAFGLFVVALRKVAPIPHMLVADRKGQLLHVTRGLAKLLHSTPKQLAANGSPHALDALLPQPLLQIHRSLTSQGAPPSAAPAFSCRLGLSVPLLTGPVSRESGELAVEVLPSRLNIKRTELLGELLHVVTVEPTDIDQALCERCLSVVLDSKGVVTQVSESPESLFGFNPKALVGEKVSSFIVELRALSNEDNGPPNADLLLSNVVSELMSWATDAPGTSWRVGFNAPISEAELMNMGARGNMVLAKRTRPAVMVVSLCNEDSYDATLQLQLWRADLITSIVELDALGIIVSAAAAAAAGSARMGVQQLLQKLYPSGLAFGAADESIEGAHISNYLPLGSRSASDLLDVLDTDGKHRLRPSLKGRPGHDAAGLAEVGPVQLLRTTHKQDGCDLELSVMAVRKMGSSAQGMYLVMHVHQPRMGRPDFGPWLLRGANPAELPPAPLEPHPPAGGGLNDGHGGSRRASLLLSHAGVRASFTAAEWPAGGASRRGSKNMVEGDWPVIASAASVGLKSRASIGKEEQLQAVDELDRLQQEMLDTMGQSRALGPVPQDAQHSTLVQPYSPFQALSGAQRELAEEQQDHDGNFRHSGSKNVRFGAGGFNVADELKDEYFPVQQDKVAAWLQTDNAQAAAGSSKGAVAAGWGSGSGNGRRSSKGGAADEELSEDGAHADVDRHTDANSDSNLLGDAGDGVADYRRGQRFKKLTKLLNSAAAQATVRRFKLHTIALVGCVIVAHIVTFAVMYALIDAQKVSVQGLNNAGLAARAAGKAASQARAIQILYAEEGAPWLKGLVNDSDIPAQKKVLKQLIDQFKALHYEVYSSISWPTDFGLYDIWKNPTLNLTMYYDVLYNETGPNNTQPAPVAVSYPRSLWDTGVLLSAKLDNFIQNAAKINASANMTVDSWSEFAFVTDNVPRVILPTYLQVLDGMVQLVANSGAKVNNIQLMILALEGCGLCMFVLVYMWILSCQVGRQRYETYKVFMAIPLSLVRGLATKRLSLSTEEDDDDDDDDTPKPSNLDQPGQQSLLEGPSVANKTSNKDSEGVNSGGGGGSTVRINISLASTKQTAADKQPAQARSTFWSVLTFWRSNQSATNQHGKRKLKRSSRAAVWMTWPFLAWGCIVVIVNAVGHSQLGLITSPIATFNLLNFVLVRYEEIFFWSEYLSIQNSEDGTRFARSQVKMNGQQFQDEYNAMLYGGRVVPDQTSSHFTLATQGVADIGGAGADLLFNSVGCLCLDPQDCKDANNEFYTYLTGGLDRLMRRVTYYITLMAMETNGDPMQWGPEFNFLWTSQPDVEGGLAQLNDIYHGHVVGVYSSVLTLHILALVLTLVIMGCYLFLMLRPFLKECANETRRIADLLSQLPSDVNVEALVQAAVTRGNDNSKQSSAGKGSAVPGNKIVPSVVA